MVKKLVPDMIDLMPLPVTLVAVADRDNVPDVFTASWVGVLCPDPFYIGVGIDAASYAHELIENDGSFTVNVMQEGFVSELDRLGRTSGRDVDKFEEVRLTPQPSKEIKAPIILEAPVSIECEVQEVMRLGTHDFYVGRVMATHIDDSVLLKNKVNMEALRPVIYAAGAYWAIGKKIKSGVLP